MSRYGEDYDGTWFLGEPAMRQAGRDSAPAGRLRAVVAAIAITGLATLLTAVFTALKLTHHVDWPWPWVLYPVPAAAALVLLAALLRVAVTAPW